MNDNKSIPVYSGVLAYFPDAIKEVAKVSQDGNDQHNPGSILHWDRSKSGDERDALTRHLLLAGGRDERGIRHSAKVAWRALAALQKEIEEDADRKRTTKIDWGEMNAQSANQCECHSDDVMSEDGKHCWDCEKPLKQNARSI